MIPEDSAMIPVGWKIDWPGPSSYLGTLLALSLEEALTMKRINKMNGRLVKLAGGAKLGKIY